MGSHRKGDFTEATVLAELKRRGIAVSVPFGDNERYDLVVETPDGDLLRIQVKTGWLSDGKIKSHGKSQHTNATGNVYKAYDGDVDYFLVYSHDLETMYLVAEDSFEKRITLRVEEPDQADPRINGAEGYEFDRTWPP